MNFILGLWRCEKSQSIDSDIVHVIMLERGSPGFL